MDSVNEQMATALTAAAYAVTATALLGCATMCAYAANLFRRWRQKDR